MGIKFNFIKSNIRMLVQLLVIILTPVVFVMIIDLKGIFNDYLANNYLTPDNFIWYYPIMHGGILAGFIFALIFLYFIRKSNCDYIMNQLRVYHDYPYAWYLLCAKFLGIRQCSPVLVPIYMQYKLAIRKTFKEYPLDDGDYPVIENEPECVIIEKNVDMGLNEINLILEDTYIIDDAQIPENKRDLFSLKISRNTGNIERHYSPQFINNIMNSVSQYSKIDRVNIFATTNPKNTISIANRVFGSDERGNIGHLYVFQQSSLHKRFFGTSGYKIY